MQHHTSNIMYSLGEIYNILTWFVIPFLLFLLSILYSHYFFISKNLKQACKCQNAQGDQVSPNQIPHDFQTATGYQMPNSSDTFNDEKNLTYDRGQIRQDANALDDQIESECMVPEPPSLSGIIDSTISNKSSSKSTDVDEKYVVDDISSLSDISDIEVSNAPGKHEYGKERMEQDSNIYDKLYNACLRGELSVINDILERENTLMPDENGQTPVYAACTGNHPEVLNILTDFGYDINHQDNEGKTPLHVVFENNDPDFANILVTQFKVNTELRDLKNWTPLHIAIDRGYFSYSQQLSQKFFQQDVGTDVGWIQLHAACFQENIRAVQILLDAITDVNHASSAGHTPLHIAVSKRNTSLVALLLDQNANVNSVTTDGKSPLHIAVEKGEETIIQQLLAQKTDLSLKDILGNTSLHLAVQLKQDTTPVLLKSRIRMSGRGSYPYEASSRPCSIQTVHAIIDHGADVNAMNNRGQTPLWFACSDGHEYMVNILLDKEADPNIVDKCRDSSLHAAINGHCSAKTIKKIIDRGAHINAVRKDGATPLLLACCAAQAESVRILLEAEADPNIAYADGDASLHAAVAAYCNKETIQEIIDYGADVNATNVRGRTALLLSCLYRQMDSVKVLLKNRSRSNSC